MSETKELIIEMRWGENSRLEIRVDVKSPIDIVVKLIEALYDMIILENTDIKTEDIFRQEENISSR